MKVLVCNKKKYRICTEWNELSKNQLLRMMPILHSKKVLDESLLHIAMLLLKKNKISFFLLPWEVKLAAMEIAEQLIKENKLTRQALPQYRNYWHTLHGPIGEFDNLIMVEFHYTETAYHNYISTKDDKFLVMLAAILYRDKKPKYDKHRNKDGDIREPFNANSLAYYTSIVKHWPKVVLWLILYWYDGCRQELVENNEAVYPPTTTTNHQNLFEGLYKMMRSMAGEKYGTFEKIEALPVHTAHLELSLMIEESNKIAEQLKAQQQQ